MIGWISDTLLGIIIDKCALITVSNSNQNAVEKQRVRLLPDDEKPGNSYGSICRAESNRVLVNIARTKKVFELNCSPDGTITVASTYTLLHEVHRFHYNVKIDRSSITFDNQTGDRRSFLRTDSDIGWWCCPAVCLLTSHDLCAVVDNGDDSHKGASIRLFRPAGTYLGFLEDNNRIIPALNDISFAVKNLPVDSRDRFPFVLQCISTDKPIVLTLSVL